MDQRDENDKETDDEETIGIEEAHLEETFKSLDICSNKHSIIKDDTNSNRSWQIGSFFSQPQESGYRQRDE